MANEFTFDGATIEERPFIPFESFKALKAGTLLKGVIVGITTYKDNVSAQVEINRHVTKVPLFGTTLSEAKEMISWEVTVKYTGQNDAGYPKLYMRY